MKKLDYKGILAFLGITFALTYAIELPVILSGIRLVGLTSSAATYIFLPTMFIPALGAVITVKFITREGFGELGLHFGPWKNYLLIGLLIPALFIIVYLVSWILGFCQPDWALEYFKSFFTSNNLPVPAMPDTRLVLLGVFFSTLTMGTLINFVACTGEEIGWRGYLLPKLMPLGKLRAYLLLGIIWSAWHWPLVWAGFVYNQVGALLAFLVFTTLTTLFGVYLNELALHNRSSILAGWAHGVFNTQKAGVWVLLFPGINPYLGGYAGLVGLIFWAGLGFWEMHRHSHRRHAK
jgi:uncharacterized protein